MSLPALSSPASAVSDPAETVRRETWLMVLVTLALLVAYSSGWRAGFVWDDDAHVTANPVIIGPLGLKEIWTSADADYFPLVLTNFWVLHRICGLSPLPYHLVTLAFHVANAWLLWRVLRRLRVPGAWLGAALWALHPVQVESVAWISELKNTQSGAFFLLAIWFFVRWQEEAGTGGRGWRFYAGALLAALAAMLSKPSTVMLPVVFALCVWWRCGRWRWRDLVTLAPFFLLSALISGWTIWEQTMHSNARGADWSENFAQRLIIAGRVVWFYLGKLAWPQPLIFIYRRWSVDPTQVLWYAAPLLVAAALGVLWWRRERPAGRALFFASACFVALLFPVLGFFSVYYFRFSFVADHFQYLASMAPLALAGAAIQQAPLVLRRGAPIGLLAICSVLSWRQAQNYLSHESLWGATLARNPECWLAHTNHALGLLAVGKNDEALEHATTAARLKPDDASVRHNLGNAQLVLGRTEEAIESFRAALRLNAKNPETHNSLGYALLYAERFPEAEAEFRTAVQLRPDYGVAHRNLGELLFRLGRLPEAIEALRAAVRSAPGDFKAWTNLGGVLFNSGEASEALAAWRTALALRPNEPAAHCNVALALEQAGRFGDARQEVEAALRLDPRDERALAQRARLEGR